MDTENKKDMTAKQLAQVKDVADKLFSLLGVVVTVQVAEVDGALQVSLESEETGMLIGHHGETLEGLQLVLSLCVAKELGEFTRISLEVGDYKKNREAYLQDMVAQAKERVLTEKTSVALPNLKSWERRVVHLLLQDDAEVVSESEGEGRERVLVIKPKAQ